MFEHPDKELAVFPATLPKHDEVHVWYCSVARAPIDELFCLLDSAEQARADAFIFNKDRNQFIAARGTLRQILGGYCGRDPTAVRFEYGKQGKPTLKDVVGGAVGIAAGVTAGSETYGGLVDLDLRFNISHSFDTVLLVFAVGQDVGVDVEYVDDRIDILDLTRSVFSQEEQQMLEAYEPEQRLRRFFQLWTAKEAYIKMLGGGLSISLQDFTVKLQSGTLPSRVHTVEEGILPCTIEHLTLPNGYMGAVAAQTGGWRMTMFNV